MKQKATLVRLHETKPNDQIIVIPSFSAHEYASMVREINNPVCSKDMLIWLWPEQVYFVDGELVWVTNSMSSYGDFYSLNGVEFCIRVEEVQ